MPAIRHSLLASTALLALAGSLLLAAPASAEDAATVKPMEKASIQAAGRGAADPVEARITKLHQQLKIAPAQEANFNALAQVMRDNRAAHDSLVEEKRQAEKTQTALDDLQAYAQIAQANADGAKKLVTAFEALYTSLSDEQKKVADEVFRQHKRRMMDRVMAHPTKAAPPAAAPSVAAPAQ